MKTFKEILETAIDKEIINEMKIRVINKQGKGFDFPSMAKAKPHINKKKINDYEIKIINGEKYRVYDDREEY